ncbi:hypothetical protein AsAng_0048150 [Aureispira anguillae]|uniref:Uncharacterized protein n=1 Tax=Aureispira anguillae TaxID=2864201 RepID=A0A916DVT1_9BACT|nr:hypothetical protein AsAng_0048150 [Aureispira anguillae]
MFFLVLLCFDSQSVNPVFVAFFLSIKVLKNN